MKDLEFKALSHCCEGYIVYSNGTQIEKNYSPDYTLSRGNQFVIIEHETEPNRKTIIADIFKASHFLQNEREGVLIIVMTPKGKSSFGSYPKHVLSYFKWLKTRTNLTDVIFVHESHYYSDNVIMIINDDNFAKKSTSLTSMLVGDYE